MHVTWGGGGGSEKVDALGENWRKASLCLPPLNDRLPRAVKSFLNIIIMKFSYSVTPPPKVSGSAPVSIDCISGAPHSLQTFSSAPPLEGGRDKGLDSSAGSYSPIYTGILIQILIQIGCVYMEANWLNPDSDHLSHMDCYLDLGPGARVNVTYVHYPALLSTLLT